MEAFIIYNIKAGVCLLAFYLLYKALLSRETFYKLNRVVLLSAIAVSFILPLGIMKIHVAPPEPAEVIATEDQGRFIAPVSDPATGVSVDVTAMAEPAPQPVTVEKSARPDLSRVMAVIFWIGAAAALAMTLWCIGRVYATIRSGRRSRIGRRIILSLTDKPVTPFSWMRYIVMSRDDHDEAGDHIITHEKAHIRSGHSADLLLADLCGCLQWFNPAIWLIKRELRDIHEYEADRAVIDSGADAASYQLLLIKKAVGTGRYSIANSLNHSNLKKRITMMLRKRSGLRARMKVLLFVPALLVGMTAFAAREYQSPESKDSKNNAPVILADSFTFSFDDTVTIPNPYPALGPATLTMKILEPGESAESVDIPLRKTGGKRTYFSPGMKIENTGIYYAYDYNPRDGEFEVTLSDVYAHNIEDMARMVNITVEPVEGGVTAAMSAMDARDLIPVMIDADGNIFVRNEPANLQNVTEKIIGTKDAEADTSGYAMSYHVILDADDNTRWGMVDALRSMIFPHAWLHHKKELSALGGVNQKIESSMMSRMAIYDTDGPRNENGFPEVIGWGDPMPYYQHHMGTETEKEAADRLVDVFFLDGEIHIDDEIVRPEDVTRVLKQKPAERGYKPEELMLGIHVDSSTRAGTVYRTINDIYLISPMFGWIVWVH